MIYDDKTREKIAEELCRQDNTFGRKPFDEWSDYGKNRWRGKAAVILGLIPDPRVCEKCGERKPLSCSTQDCEVMELLIEYQSETERCYEIAQRLDALNPEVPDAFIGNPSERIERQLKYKGLFGC